MGPSTIKGPLQSGRKGFTMARRSGATAEEDFIADQSTVLAESPDVDVDVAPADDEQEVAAVQSVDGPAEGEKKAPKAKKEPSRGDLPEGFITPVGLAKVINERKLHTNRDGEVVDVVPQMVYSYIKNAPKEDPYPSVPTKDSLGKDRENVAETEKAVAWWIRKNERAAARKANGAAKAAKKAEKATSTEQSTDSTAVEPEAAVEAE